MNKKASIAIVLLITILVGIFFIASRMQKKQAPLPTTTHTVSAAPAKQVNAQTVLSFSQNPYTVSSSTSSLDITINSGENNVTAVQIELSYNPAVLTNVAIQPGDFLTGGFELLKKIDTKVGKIVYALAIQPTGIPKKGTGTVAVLTFTSNLTAGQKTEIKMLQTTLVTAENEQASVLKQAFGTTIAR